MGLYFSQGDALGYIIFAFQAKVHLSILFQYSPFYLNVSLVPTIYPEGVLQHSPGQRPGIIVILYSSPERAQLPFPH